MSEWQSIKSLFLTYDSRDEDVLIWAINKIYLTTKKRVFDYGSVTYWMPLPKPPSESVATVEDYGDIPEDK